VSAPLISERRLSIIGGLLIALGPISLSLYTPALPELVEVFGTDISTIKLTLTVYFAGFAVSQLICGPLSDGFGRRPVALAFVAIYLAGSIVAALAPSVEWLLAARLIQGVGAAAGVSIARAMVRDLFTGLQSIRIMNLIGMILAIGPALSPTIGGVALDLFGWRATFLFMVLYGAVLAGVLLLLTPETLPDADPTRVRPLQILRNYGRVVSSSAFLAPSAFIACTIGGFYTIATVLSFVMIDEIGLTPTEFGLSMMMQSGAYLAGAVIMRNLLKRFDAHRLVPIGLVTIGLGGALLAVLLRVADPTFFSVMGPLALIFFGIAFTSPSMQTAALAPFAQIAGSASAMMGFFQMGGGFLGSAIAAWLGDPVQAVSTILPAMIGMAIVIYFVSRGLMPRRMRDSVADRIIEPPTPPE
jgi:DHA1 family bicyclomycin/chloramphenicol resistance-like MFS transporter